MAELLYTWSNHGVSASEIEVMEVTENRDIGLIYRITGANYLKLMLATEEVEIIIGLYFLWKALCLGPSKAFKDSSVTVRL